MIRRNAGFTLMEVLIAVFVLGIGLLGVAGLQSVALNMNQGSYLRSQATLMARDIADRMRANRPAAMQQTPGPDVSFPNMEYDMVNGAAATPNAHSGCVDGSGCSPLNMVENDLFEWSQSLANRLPQGDGIVCRDSTPADGAAPATGGGAACDNGGDRYAVKIWWFDTQVGQWQRFVTEVRP